MRRLINDQVKFYIVDDIQISDPLAEQVNYNLLEGTIRHDVAYSYFTDMEAAFVSLADETAEFVFFTKPSNTFDPDALVALIGADISEYALIGHLLDYGTKHYELHNQCFLISTEAYRKCGAKPYTGGSSAELLEIKRSMESYHDNYTPLWVSAGDKKHIYEDISPGAEIISAFLENGYKIRPFNEQERRNKRYLYYDLTMHYGSYLRMETHLSDVVFNCATEPLPTEEFTNIQRIITPANGLQALSLIDKCPNLRSVEFKDVNENQISFTLDLIAHYNGENYADFCYGQRSNMMVLDRETIDIYERLFLDNLSTDFATFKERLEGLQIQHGRESFFELDKFVRRVKPRCNTMYNFSNIMSYRKTYHLYSQIHFSLMLKALANEERKCSNDSIFWGFIPSSESPMIGICNTSVNSISLYPDPALRYEWRPRLQTHYEEYLAMLRGELDSP